MENRNNIGLLILTLAIGFCFFMVIRSRQIAIISLLQSRALTDVIEATIGSDDYGFVIMDSSGKVILWNHAMEAMSGYSREEMLGKDYKDIPIIPDEKMKLHVDGFHRAMHDPSRVGVATTVYCKMQTKDGEVPIRVVVRVVATPDKKKYATANIERMSSIVRIENGKQVPVQAAP